jgi:hypothetical protein
MGDVQGFAAELRDLLKVAGFDRERYRLPPCSDGAAFHGEWIGRWTNGRDGTLVVQRIQPSREKGAFRASGVYSFGTHQAENGGFREFDATIKAGQLLIQYGKTIIRYTIAKDRRHLNGVWDSVVLTGEFQKAIPN